MSLVHLHLLLNHLPVIGNLFILIVFAVALWRRNSDMGKVGLVLLAGIAAVTIVVYLTGGAAEDAVEHLPGFSKSLIEAHEEAAEAATYAMSAAGVLAVALLWVFWRRDLPRWATLLGFVVLLAVGGLMAWTANLGGQIRHEEIRSGVPTDPASPPVSHRVNVSDTRLPAHEPFGTELRLA